MTTPETENKVQKENSSSLTGIAKLMKKLKHKMNILNEDGSAAADHQAVQATVLKGKESSYFKDAIDEDSVEVSGNYVVTRGKAVGYVVGHGKVVLDSYGNVVSNPQYRMVVAFYRPPVHRENTGADGKVSFFSQAEDVSFRGVSCKLGSDLAKQIEGLNLMDKVELDISIKKPIAGEETTGLRFPSANLLGLKVITESVMDTKATKGKADSKSAT